MAQANLTDYGTRASRPRRLIGQRIREDLAVAVERDPSVGSAFEAVFCPQLLCLWAHRVAHAAYRRDHRVLARAIALVGRLVSGGVDIHPGAQIGRRFFLDHGAATVIGESAVIGDDVTLYHQVTIGGIGWQRDTRRPQGERRHPVIGDRVTIGANASVLGPVVVGKDVTICAHAMVTHDVPAGSKVRPPASEVTIPGPAEANQRAAEAQPARPTVAQPPVGQVRIARHTQRLDAVVSFYRDKLGLPELGSFAGHASYDGVFLDIPGTRAHLEFTSGGGHAAVTPGDDDLLVLYLGTWERVAEVGSRLGDPVPSRNPYWDQHGRTYADPDGARVVLVAQCWNRPTSLPFGQY